VEHALAVCRAYVGNDFVRFLRLYEGAPRMAPYLMDLLLGRLRGQAYSECVVGPGHPACLLAQELASSLCWGAGGAGGCLVGCWVLVALQRNATCLHAAACICLGCAF
jgi:hypothetical protein